MATKSFLKNVTIKKKKDCSKLLHALESAQKQKSVPVEFSRSYSLATKDEIDKILRDIC